MKMLEAVLHSGIVTSSSSYNMIRKFSKLMNLLAVIFLLWEITRLCRRFVNEIQKQLTITYIGFVMRILDFVLWLYISLRKLNGETTTLSKLFAVSVRHKYVDVGVMLVTGVFVTFLESGLSISGLVSGDGYTCSIILLIRLGFECSMVTILVTQEQFYKQSNDCIRQTITNPMNLLEFRPKYEKLHSYRVAINESYSNDLFLYFASSQIIMLLECLDMTKALVKEENILFMLLPGLRFLRVLLIMSYVIWRWQKVSDECSKILTYLFEQNIEKFSSPVFNQIELLIDDVQLRNKLFSANKYYNINMNLLYNISGTVFAYFILILTVAVNQRKSIN